MGYRLEPNAGYLMPAHFGLIKRQDATCPITAVVPKGRKEVVI